MKFGFTVRYLKIESRGVWRHNGERGAVRFDDEKVQRYFDAAVEVERYEERIGALPVDYNNLLDRPDIVADIVRMTFDVIEMDEVPMRDDPPGTIY
jgi:hypothetical protein